MPASKAQALMMSYYVIPPSINNAFVLIVFLAMEICRQIFVADLSDVFGSGNVFVLILLECSDHVSRIVALSKSSFKMLVE